jgi:hypothetical protein
MTLALPAVRLLHSIESAMGWQSRYDPSSAMMLLGTMAASIRQAILRRSRRSHFRETGEGQDGGAIF